MIKPEAVAVRLAAKFQNVFARPNSWTFPKMG